MKTFKSERAAKMAHTKALRAYNKAKSLSNVRQEWDEESSAWLSLDWDTVIAPRREAATKAFEHMSDIYEAAKAQGYSLSNWYLGPNATRDLIAQNID